MVLAAQVGSSTSTSSILERLEKLEAAKTAKPVVVTAEAGRGITIAAGDALVAPAQSVFDRNDAGHQDEHQHPPSQQVSPDGHGQYR